MNCEAFPGASQASGSSMDNTKSEERHPGRKMTLNELLTYAGISVKEEPGTSTHPPSFDGIEVKEELMITSQLVPVLPTVSTDVKKEPGRNFYPPTFNNREGHALPGHSAMKGPHASNSDMCNAGLHASLTPVETNSETRNAQQPKCTDSNRRDPSLKRNKTNNESDTTQEPQCLGPFEESSSIKCPFCPVELTNSCHLTTHSCITQHIYNESTKLKPKCCLCETVFSGKRSLIKHLKTHVTKTYVKCSFCGKHVTSATAFKTHALTHTNRWPYHCKICGRGAAREDILRFHEATHTGEKSSMCDVCGALFANERGLHRHRKIHSEKKYECEICFAKFKMRSAVKKHKEIHSVREKFQCGDCESAFMSKQQLKLHKEIKHGDNSGGESFICNVCNKEFNHKFPFRIHMYKHKVRNENIMYTCDMCKRKFSNKHSLARHIAEHSGKKFSCSHCGMLFTQLGSVKRHKLKLHAIKE